VEQHRKVNYIEMVTESFWDVRYIDRFPLCGVRTSLTMAHRRSYRSEGTSMKVERCQILERISITSTASLWGQKVYWRVRMWWVPPSTIGVALMGFNTLNVELMWAVYYRAVWWVYIRLHLPFHNPAEGALTHEMGSLKTTVATLKLKGIDGGLHKRWSMWFNSI